MTAELGLLTGVVLVWTLVEGRTILVAAGHLLPGGAVRTDRLSWGFLGSETWSLALLGLAHCLTPTAAHEVYSRLPWAPVVFVAGWMLRDHGLWFRRRAGAGTGRDVLITAGGLAQIVGAVAVLGVCATLRPELSLGAGGPLLILVAPPILAVGALLQWWLRRLLVHR